MSYEVGTLGYNNFHASVQYNEQDGLFHGTVKECDVTFQTDNVADIERVFHQTIDDHITKEKERKIDEELAADTSRWGKFKNWLLHADLDKITRVIDKITEFSKTKWFTIIILLIAIVIGVGLQM